MKVDRFMSKLGIAEVQEVSDEALERLCNQAEAFVRAGVTLTLTDCLDMNEATLAAFMKARELVEEESRTLLVAALRSNDAEAALDQAADAALFNFVRNLGKRAS